jgi:hypothetical protein
VTSEVLYWTPINLRVRFELFVMIHDAFRAEKHRTLK